MLRFILFFSLFSPFALVFGDCNCCCCDDPSGGGQEGGAPTAAQCIQISPEDCASIKSTLNARVADIDSRRNILYDNVIYEIRGFAALFFGDVINAIDSVGIDVSITSQYLDSEDFQIQVIQGKLVNLRNRFTTYNNQWASVGTGKIAVSNLSTHAGILFPASSNPARWLPTELSNIEDIQNDLSNLANTNAFADSSISRVSSGLSSLRSLVESGFGRLDTAVSSAEQVYNDLNSISASITSANGQLNCASCSSGGGGGGGGSGGTTVDITPLVQAVNALNLQMQTEFNNLKSFLGLLFTDYDQARRRSFSNQDITYSTYSGLDNWFSRMELLLYKASGMDSGNNDDTIEDPVDTDIIQSASDDFESNQHSMEQSLTNNVISFDYLMSRVSALYQRFSFLGSSSKPSTYVFVPDYVVGQSTYNVVLSSPGWLDTALDWVRYLFQAFYLIVFCSGLWFFSVLLFRNARTVFEFFVKVYAAVFGGGS